MTKEVIIIHETVAQSVIKDAVSIGALTLAVGLGVYMQSTAMQWVAGVMWVLYMLSASLKNWSDRKMTVEAARKRLDEIEAKASLTSFNASEEGE
jgi:hypothetical protein